MNFKHILFPTDFSERSLALTREVEWVANSFGSRVTLMNVVEIPAMWCAGGEATFINTSCLEALRDSAKQRLTDYTIRVPESRVERVVAEGDVAAEILNCATERNVDLIMMGTHGYGALQGWILGSVTAKVLHQATCPVWTDSPLHDQAKDPGIGKILCALELTEEAAPLLRFVDRLGRTLGATVRLVHSVHELEPRPTRYFDFDFDLNRYLMDAARVGIAKLQRDVGTEFPVSMRSIGISNALSEAAAEHGADLIVIGRGRAQKAFGRFQTHAYEIIRYAPCPVLSYSLDQQDHTSSSCIAEHPSQFEEDVPLLTGSRKS